MRRRLLLCCALASTIGAQAATITIACPDKFPAEAIEFNNAPSGWIPYAPNALEVHTAELMYGPPASRTYVAPTSYHEGRRRDVGLWGASDRYENWLQCGYGAASEVTLARRLPPVTDCTITKEKDKLGNVEKVVASCTAAPPR